MKKFYLDDVIACIFILVTIIVVVINVGMRYFFNNPIKSAEEIATICFIWAVFVGGASCYRKKMHMGIDILVQLAPIKYKKVIELLVGILVAIITGTIFYLSIKFTYISRIKPTAVLGISSVYVNSSLIVGFGLVFIYSLGEIIKLIRKKGENHE